LGLKWTCDLEELSRTIEACLGEAVNEIIAQPLCGIESDVPHWDFYKAKNLFSRPLFDPFGEQLPTIADIEHKMMAAVASLRAAGAHPHKIHFVGVKVVRDRIVVDDARVDTPALEALIVAEGIDSDEFGEARGHDLWGFQTIQSPDGNGRDYFKELSESSPVFLKRFNAFLGSRPGVSEETAAQQMREGVATDQPLPPESPSRTSVTTSLFFGKGRVVLNPLASRPPRR
jgi:hypothetical protein